MKILNDFIKTFIKTNKLFVLTVLFVFLKSLVLLSYVITDAKSFAIFYTIGCIPSYLLYFSFIVILFSLYFMLKGKQKPIIFL